MKNVYMMAIGIMAVLIAMPSVLAQGVYTPSSETHEIADGQYNTILYSGTMFTQDDGIWMSGGEFINTRWTNGRFYIGTWDGEYFVALRPFIRTVSGSILYIEDLKIMFPNTDFGQYVTVNRFNHKFAFNFTSVPQNLVDNAQYVGLVVDDSHGLTWDDVELNYETKQVTIKDKISISYMDLIESQYTVNLYNKTVLLIGNISENYRNEELVFDPTIQLQQQYTENMNDIYCDVVPGNCYNGSTLYIGFDGSTSDPFRTYIQFNTSKINGDYIITNMNLSLFVYSEFYEAGENPIINVYNITEPTWDETIASATNSPPDNGSIVYGVNDYTSGDGFTGWLTIDITNLNNSAINNSNLSVLIITESGGSSSDLYAIYSKDYTTDATKRPYLSIMYTGAPGACYDGYCDLNFKYLIADVSSREGAGLPGVNNIQYKWDIRDLECPVATEITEANLTLYISGVTTPNDNDAYAYSIFNQTWEETPSCAEYLAFSQENQTTETWSSIVVNTWATINVTEQIRNQCLEGYDNFTIRIEDPDHQVSSCNAVSDTGIYFGGGSFVSQNTINFRQNEYGYNDSQRPRLEVWYSEEEADTTPPTVTLNSPPDLNKTYNYTTNFTCHVIDAINVSNVSLWGNWTGSWHLNQTNTSSINDTNYTFTVYTPVAIEDVFVWNCYGCDNSTNCAYATSNRTIEVHNASRGFYNEMNLSETNNSIYMDYGNTFFAEWNAEDFGYNLSDCLIEMNNTVNYTGTIDGIKCRFNFTLNLTANVNHTFRGWSQIYPEGAWNTTPDYWVFVNSLNPAGYWIMRAPVNDTSAQEIGDSYARRCYDVTSGCYKGNGQDVGVLWRNETLDESGRQLQDEERHCGAWTNMYFDEPGYSNGTIYDIYCHVWIRKGDDIGLSTVYSPYDDYIGSTKQTVSTITEGNATYFDLVIFNITAWNWAYTEAEDFQNLSVKSRGTNVQSLMYPNQRSFCIINNINGINLSDTETLKGTDYDGDGVSDYDELFVKYTDPYDIDTDDDTHLEQQEYDNNRIGYDPYDWGTRFIYNLNDTWQYGYNETNKNLGTEPQPDSVFSTLITEFTTDQYNKTSVHDLSTATFATSGGINQYGEVQLNFHFNITQDPDDLSNINFFFGSGDVPPVFEEVVDYSNTSLYIHNFTDGSQIRAGGRKGGINTMYLKQLRDENFSEIINSTGNAYFGWYEKHHGTGWSKGRLLDFVEIWVIVRAEDYVDINSPTEASPFTATAGENITVTYDFFEGAGEIIDGVTTENITLVNDTSSTLCTLSGIAMYIGGVWVQNCTAPALQTGEYYNVTILANTSTSGWLNDTEKDAVHYGPLTTLYYRYATTTMAYSDTIKRQTELSRIQQTTINYMDFTSLSRSSFRTASSFINYADFTARKASYARYAQSTLTYDDFVSRVSHVGRSVFTTLNYADFTGFGRSFLRFAVTTISYSDFASRLASYSRYETTTLAYDDFVSRAMRMNRQVSTAMDYYDFIAIGRSIFRYMATEIGYSDFTNRRMLMTRSVNSTFSYLDFLGIKSPTELFQRYVSTAINYADSLMRRTSYHRYANSSVDYTDFISRLADMNRQASTSLQYSDFVSRIMFMNRHTSTTLAYHDFISEVYTSTITYIYRQVFTYITYADLVGRQMDMTRHVSTDINYGDFLSRIYTTYRSAFTTISYDDFVSRVVSMHRGIFSRFYYYDWLAGSFPETIPPVAIIRWLMDQMLYLLVNNTNIYMCDMAGPNDPMLCTYVGGG